MKETTSIINNQQGQNNIQHLVNCAWCNSNFGVKFVRSKQNYSQKNNWGYWTEKEEDKDKYICSECLRNAYSRDFLNFSQQVTSKKKRQIIRVYFYTKLL